MPPTSSNCNVSLLDKPVQIPLTLGYVAIVDAVDADLNDRPWHTLRGRRHIYARRYVAGVKSPRVKEMLHRVIFARVVERVLLPTEVVDHINGNSLDNRRSNLRLATPAENSHNRVRPSTNSTGYKGVSYSRRAGKWTARISVNKRSIFLGLHDSPEQAARVYIDAAQKYHGEFARTE